MTVYDVMNEQLFDADKRARINTKEDEKLINMISVEWAIKIQLEQQY